MNRYIYLVILLFFFCTSLFAQTPSVAIGTGKSCAGQEVLLSVTASDLLNIGSITLYVDVDTTRLTFLNLENIDPQLQDLYVNFIQNPPKVAVVWNNVVAVNLPQNRLFDLKFKVRNSVTPVAFSTGCEIANSSYQVLGINWIGGGVESANPVISVQPRNTTIGVAKNTSFEISSNATAYQWEVSQDGTNWQMVQDEGNYSGSSTNRLLISNVPMSLNNLKYRCDTWNGVCTTISDGASLTVEASSAIIEGINRQNFHLENEPNPFNETTKIKYTLPEEGNVRIRIFSVLGNQVGELLNDSKPRGLNEIVFFSTELSKGIYICQLEFSNERSSLMYSRKMIKN